MARRVRGGERAPSLFFETTDDRLAAYLVVRGVRRVGLGRASDDDEVTHVFDDAEERIRALVDAFQKGRRDLVSASRYAVTLEHLRSLRLDEERRLRARAGD